MRSLLAISALAVLLAGGSPADPAAAPLEAGAVAGDHGPAGGAEADAAAVRPVPGPVVRRFDPPSSPWGPGSRGVRLAVGEGTRVVAALDGHVAFSGQVAGRGWVTVAHGGGLVTTYGPVEPRLVRAGVAVTRGQPLGEVAEGADELHWGARVDGAYVDPLALLRPWRVRLVGVERR